MGNQAARFEQLRQQGFVDVDKWKYFDEWTQQNLLAVLRNDSQATVLNLSNCEIGDANAEVLAGYLKNNTHLTVLYLSFNQLTDAGVQPIAEALANHPALMELMLDNRDITDASCPALADLLRTVPTLERLDLRWTSITAKGKVVLAAAVGRTELDYLLICPTEEERMRAARNNARWNEDQHYRTAVDFRRGLAETLSCLDEDADAVIPWDDIRRMMQGWGIVRFRRRWGGGKGGRK